ncbi:MAG: hypothetical protein ACR2RV_24060 [Verrucomicrobiales bacterium]
MSEPSAHPQQVPGAPPQPPKKKVPLLWITLIAPSLVLGLLCTFAFALIAFGIADFFAQAFINLARFLIYLTTAIAWGFYIKVIGQRFHGPSFVLLILA